MEYLFNFFQSDLIGPGDMLAGAVLGVTERLPFTSMVVPLFKSKWSGNDLLSISSPPYYPSGASIEMYCYYAWL
jgi:hypothetical protein